MSRARKVCAEIGCPVLAVEGGNRCPGHTAAAVARQEAKHKERQKEYDANRPSAQDRGYGAKHRAWRARVLARDRVCQGWPHGSGCGENTDTADHVRPIRQGGKRFDPANGRGMCTRCHNRKRQQESHDAKRQRRGG